MIGSLVRKTALRTPLIPSEIKSAFDESKQEGGDALQLLDMAKVSLRKCLFFYTYKLSFLYAIKLYFLYPFH